jgi:hypothetical protein
VYNESELKSWLTANNSGTVYLGASIDITMPIFIEHPVTINTGEYGLVYNGGFLYLTGAGFDAMIIGEGVSTPVLEVFSLGNLFMGDWNNYLYTLNITANGLPDGSGGTAIRLRTSGAGALEPAWLTENEPGRILAFGDGAVGIELMDSFDLYCFHIEVNGENSAAVSANKNAAICFSKLSAVGGGALAVKGDGNIVLDSTTAEPLLTAGNILIQNSRLSPVYIPVKLDTSLQDFMQLIDGRPASLAGGSAATRNYGLEVKWDFAACLETDLDVIGRHIVAGEVKSGWFRDLLPGVREMIIDVRDPQIPCIYDVEYLNAVYDARFSLWTSEVWETSDCILWYSADSGDS